MTQSTAPLRALGLLLALKTLLLALPLGVLREDAGQLLLGALASLSVLGIARRRAWGVTVLVVALVLRVLFTHPHTLNHAWFELILALVLWRAAGTPNLRIIVQARVVLRLAILSVFFYSGVQKLAHGQFVSGEYLLRSVAFESSPMADHLRRILQHGTPLPMADRHGLTLHPIQLEVTSRLHATLRLLSIGIVAAELILPVLVLTKVSGARWVLLATQIGIGLISGETDFALTATGLLLLLWRAPPRASWIAAFVGWIGVAAIMASV